MGTARRVPPGPTPAPSRRCAERRRRLELLALALAALAASLPSRLPAPAGPATEKPRRVVLDDFEDDVSRRWQNMEPCRMHVRQGKGAGRWSGELTDAVNLKLPHDWTPYEKWSLSVWCHSAKATGTRFLIILTSDNTKTDGPDFLYHPVTVDWTGWRQIRVPLRGLKAWENPVGLKQVDAVSFNTSLDWAGASRAPQTVLDFDELVLEE